MLMLDWKSKQFEKVKKASRTPGKSKNENCQATYLDKYFAARNRSYKNPEYSVWCKRKTGSK